MTEIIVPKQDAITHVTDEDVPLLSLADKPENIIAQATNAANAVMAIIESNPKPVKFNGVLYMENDHWVLAARFFGITVRIVKDEYVEFGTVKGFQAEAEAYLVSTGQVIGRAFAMCLDDEENWGLRPKYKWEDELDKDGKKIWEERIVNGKKKKLPRGKRVQDGVVKVPLFQLRSMAQTRSSSKVLSMLLKFIPVLASKGGKKVSTTPAEEADGTWEESGGEDNSQPTRAKRKAQPEAEEKPRDPDCITTDEQKFLYTVSTKCKLSHDEVKAKLQAEFKGKDGQPLKSSADMLKKDLQVYLDSVDPRFLHHAPQPPEEGQEEPGAAG